MASVMELTQTNQANVPFPFLMGEESPHLPNCGSFVCSGGAPEELSAMFEIADSIGFHGSSSESSPLFPGAPGPELALPAEGGSDSSSVGHTDRGIECKFGEKRIKLEPGVRFVFRTKSDVDVLDDGYKWRKYGKKSVKNSPNPRNYYRCSADGCRVKKRVQRDWKDSRYVLTEYDGVHNHLQSSEVVFYPVLRDHIATRAAAEGPLAVAGWGSSSSWMDHLLMMAASQPWEPTQAAHSSS